MWCVFLNERVNEEETNGLLWGSPDEIARALIARCDALARDCGADVMSGICDDYLRLRTGPVTPEGISCFYYRINCRSLETWMAVDDCTALAKGFDAFARDRRHLKHWRMTPGFSRVDLAALDAELRTLDDAGDREFRYFQRKQD